MAANETDHSATDADAGSLREIVVHHRSGWFWKLLATTGWLLAAGLLIYALWNKYSPANYFSSKGGISEQFHSGSETAKSKIAIITIAGVIQDGHGYVKRQIDRVKEDTDVKAVVVRVNSPGGTVSGSDYILHHLIELRQQRQLPMVVSMGPIAASGGYYVSMAVGDQPDSIFAEPTTTTGSIGVIIPHYNVAGLMEEYKIENDSIMSHPRKNMLSPGKRLAEDQRALLQEYVNESFSRFKQIILDGRPEFRKQNQQENGDQLTLNDPETGRDLATGEVFTAMKAHQFGLVDQIGFLESAVERAAELAGVSVDSSRVVKYSAPAPWIDLPYLNQAGVHRSPSQAVMDQVLNSGSPQAYYLASSFPPLMHSWQEHLPSEHDDP